MNQDHPFLFSYHEFLEILPVKFLVLLGCLAEVKILLLQFSIAHLAAICLELRLARAREAALTKLGHLEDTLPEG